MKMKLVAMRFEAEIMIEGYPHPYPVYAAIV